jgi:hypothetical protein
MRKETAMQETVVTPGQMRLGNPNGLELWVKEVVDSSVAQSASETLDTLIHLQVVDGVGNTLTTDTLAKHGFDMVRWSEIFSLIALRVEDMGRHFAPSVKSHLLAENHAVRIVGGLVYPRIALGSLPTIMRLRYQIEEGHWTGAPFTTPTTQAKELLMQSVPKPPLSIPMGSIGEKGNFLNVIASLMKTHSVKHGHYLVLSTKELCSWKDAKRLGFAPDDLMWFWRRFEKETLALLLPHLSPESISELGCVTVGVNEDTTQRPDFHAIIMVAPKVMWQQENGYPQFPGSMFDQGNGPIFTTDQVVDTGMVT